MNGYKKKPSIKLGNEMQIIRTIIYSQTLEQMQKDVEEGKVTIEEIQRRTGIEDLTIDDLKFPYVITEERCETKHGQRDAKDTLISLLVAMLSISSMVIALITLAMK